MRHFFKPKFINYYADSTHIRVSRRARYTFTEQVEIESTLED